MQPNETQIAKFSDEWMDEIFVYHAPTEKQLAQYRALRSGARDFAMIIRDNTPPSADRTDAIRKVREAVQMANAAVATGGIG